MAGPYPTKMLFQALAAQVDATTQVLGFDATSATAGDIATFYNLVVSSAYAADVAVGVQFESAEVAALVLSKLEKVVVNDPGAQQLLAMYEAAQVLRLGRRLIFPAVRPPPQAGSVEVTLRLPSGAALTQRNGLQETAGFGVYASQAGADRPAAPASLDVGLVYVPFRLRPGQFLPTRYLPGPQPAPLALEVVDNSYEDLPPVLRYRTAEGRLYVWPVPTLVDGGGQVGGGDGGSAS